MSKLAMALILLLGASATASAGQSLIPTPYPSGVAGAEPLNPPDEAPGGPQRLLRDPYPQAIGPLAQGNPVTMHRRRHQRLTPTSNQRRYGVDRIPTYPSY